MRAEEPGERLAGAVFGERLETARRYVDILLSRGVDYGLVGPREVDRVWERHILNSVAMAALIPAASTVVDVGSGAGLPGLPLAILRPDLTVTLLEPLLRRSTFLEATVTELRMTGSVEVVRGRAEDHRGVYDIVTARAVAPLDRLVRWCNPLRSPAGTILALKGRTAPAELNAASPLLAKLRLRADVLSVQAHPEAEPTTVVRIVGASRPRVNVPESEPRGTY